ncbi:YD repeat protein [Prevotella pallens ATCC 700821]|uniref:RHS repeat-associated protein n=2 Tax=Prevotella pallens TaxID=60133 RepID=A0ABX9DS22_9BACT|nr:YD repeat protein [Prevotella pallens ATCC 700821]RAS45773.1 RHS repeat-associated protein [Prevotella pallens]
MNQIQKQKEAYYKQQGIAPGVPTMKGAYGDPENTKRGYNSIIDTLGNHDVPQGWIQTPRPNTTPNTSPGPPVSWNDPSNPDDPQAGYGYIPNDTTKEETFFYHSDHLGSTSYITDDKANITQYDAYLPHGELLVDEHSSSEELPYKFNGKQFDEETGLYYYGARYMNPVASLWYGVDRLAEKYSQLSSFSYCAGNPIKYVDAMNVIRQELNMQWKNFGQRLNYKSIIPNEKTISSFLPFDRSSLNSIKMGMNPSPFSQYIEINVRK